MPASQHHEFVIPLLDFAELTDELENCVLGAGFDDALLFSRDGQVYLRVMREAESYQAALLSALEALERAGLLWSPDYASGATNTTVESAHLGASALRSLSSLTFTPEHA